MESANPTSDLDTLSKAELVERAQSLGLDRVEGERVDKLNKTDIKDAIRRHVGEEPAPAPPVEILPGRCIGTLDGRTCAYVRNGVCEMSCAS